MVIHARGLARTFKKKQQEVRAVDGVDLDVDAGEIVGFLGPKSAAKTAAFGPAAGARAEPARRGGQ